MKKLFVVYSYNFGKSNGKSHRIYDLEKNSNGIETLEDFKELLDFIEENEKVDKGTVVIENWKLLKGTSKGEINAKTN